jgi:hypothetical protein
MQYASGRRVRFFTTERSERMHTEGIEKIVGKACQIQNISISQATDLLYILKNSSGRKPKLNTAVPANKSQ